MAKTDKKAAKRNTPSLRRADEAVTRTHETTPATS